MPIKDPVKRREYHRKRYAEVRRKQANLDKQAAVVAASAKKRHRSIDEIELPADDGIFPFYWQLPGYQ